MDLTSLAALTLTALALGLFTGRFWERAARAWADLRTAKAQVPILRAAAGCCPQRQSAGSESRPW